MNAEVLKRKHPRLAIRKKIGILSGGQYFTCFSNEISEGGISVESEYVLSEGAQLVLTFKIPQGDFVSTIAQVKTTIKKSDVVVHGLQFINMPFHNRRQIRSFVSSQVEYKEMQ